MSVPERGGVWPPVAVMICGLVYLSCLSIFLPYLPTAAGTVGHDYALHFPNLLAAVLLGPAERFRQHSLVLAGAQCGGFPYFPDPNVAYVSMPQLLVFAVSPMRAVQLTFALFALIGLLGAYALMRHGFRSSRAAAVLAAGLFVFNGFFAYRLLIGHLTFHAFTLMPLMVVALLPIPLGRDTWAAVSVRVCVAGACLAYMFQSGMIHGIPPVLLATTVVLLIHGLCWLAMAALAAAWRRRRAVAHALCRQAGRGAVAAVEFPARPVSAARHPGLPTLLRMVAQALFLSPPADALDRIVNTQWLLERSEWEYGVSVVPGLLIVASVLIALVRRREQAPLAGVQIVALSVILVLLAIPIAVNWYQSAWNGILEVAALHRQQQQPAALLQRLYSCGDCCRMSGVRPLAAAARVTAIDPARAGRGRAWRRGAAECADRSHLLCRSTLSGGAGRSRTCARQGHANHSPDRRDRRPRGADRRRQQSDDRRRLADRVLSADPRLQAGEISGCSVEAGAGGYAARRRHQSEESGLLSVRRREPLPAGRSFHDRAIRAGDGVAHLSSHRLRAAVPAETGDQRQPAVADRAGAAACRLEFVSGAAGRPFEMIGLAIKAARCPRPGYLTALQPTTRLSMGWPEPALTQFPSTHWQANGTT